MRKLEEDWKVLENRLRYCPGKELLARFNDKIQPLLKISITESLIIDQLTTDMIDPELKEILTELDEFCDLKH